jgi:signal peptidase I
MFRSRIPCPLPVLLIGSFLSYLLFSRVLGTAVVAGDSMLPTLKPGQICLIQKWAFFGTGPRRGDLIVYRHPDVDGLTVKRVIGVPGDDISFRYPDVLVNGVRLREDYLSHGGEVTTCGSLREDTVHVPAHSYFVLGDNRNASEDSRFTGMVEGAWIVGRIKAWGGRPAAGQAVWSRDKEPSRQTASGVDGTSTGDGA